MTGDFASNLDEDRAMRAVVVMKVGSLKKSSERCLLVGPFLLQCATFISCSQWHGEVCRSDLTQRTLAIDLHALEQGRETSLLKQTARRVTVP